MIARYSRSTSFARQIGCTNSTAFPHTLLLCILHLQRLGLPGDRERWDWTATVSCIARQVEPLIMQATYLTDVLLAATLDDTGKLADRPTVLFELTHTHNMIIYPFSIL